MNDTHSFEKTDAFVGSEWRGKHAAGLPVAVPPFVTLSRESGSGGASLARLIVRELNAHVPAEVCWSVTEGSITSQMLRQYNLSSHLGRFLPEDRVSEISSSVGELVGLHPSLWDLIQKTNLTMRQLARRGHVVLVGRGANFATAGLPGGVHVRLQASTEYRARYLAQFYSLSEQEALKVNARRDAAARRYVRANFNADIGDPAAYDLIINTAHVPLAEAAQLVIAQIRARMQARPAGVVPRPTTEAALLAFAH